MGQRTNLENNIIIILRVREKAIILRGRGGEGLELLRLQPVATKSTSLTAQP